MLRARRMVLPVAIVFMVMFVFFLVIYWTTQAQENLLLEQLQQRGVTATAQIIDRSSPEDAIRNNSRRDYNVTYSFSVNQIVYTNMISVRGSEAYKSLPNGALLSVRYLPQDPNQSRFATAQPVKLTDALVAVGLAAALITVAAMVCAWVGSVLLRVYLRMRIIRS
jgi:biopolymer transport protein ExbB/TolQ